MKRLVVIAAALLAFSAVSGVTATVSSGSVCQSNGTGCTKGGSYPDPNAVITANTGLSTSITWTSTYVQPYSSGVPLYWTAGVTYYNYGSLDTLVECVGSWTNASYVQEYMQGGSGDSGGYVPASSTTCSQNPGATYPLDPGQRLTLYATFHNVPWPGSSVSINWGDYGHSPYIYPFGKNDIDWANSNFCHRSWKYAPKGAPYIGITYKGVAVCGNSVSAGNNQGPISYNGVYFDNGGEPGTGFQCVELAARYFYFETTQNPPAPPTGGRFVSALGSAPYNYQIYPAGIMKGTRTFQSSLTAGNIISMWSSKDPSGESHVAVVTQVSVSGGNGTIDVVDENASAKLLPNGLGNDMITVSGGKMSYYGLYDEFQWTTNLPGSG